MPTPQYPLINGLRYDFTSLDCTIAGTPFTGINGLNYKHSLEPGEARGNRAQVLGRSRGKYSAEGSLEMFVHEFDVLTTLLTAQGLGFLEQSFDIIASYSEVGGTVITDQLIGCRLKTDDFSGKEGGENLMIKADLHIMYLVKNGKLPMSAKQLLR